MTKALVLFSLISVIYTSFCNAKQVTLDKQFVFGLDLGIASTNHHSVKFPLGYSTFKYTPDKKVYSSARYGVSLGRRFTIDPLNNIIIGLSYHQLNSLNVRGELQQGITPPLYSANYRYSIQLSQLLAEVKLQHQFYQNFYPYLTAGIGGGFNTAKHFRTNVPNYLTFTPSFTNNHNTSLNYALGLGIDTLVTSNITLGLGYIFSDLGEVGLGNGFIRGRTLSNYINQSHLYLNTVLMQLNWYF